MAKAVLVATLALVPAPHNRHCTKLYTVSQDMRIARTVFAGTGSVTLDQFKLLGYMERCQRVPAAQKFTRWYNRHLRSLHRARIAASKVVALPYTELASYYYDAGNTASGYHSYYGVANKTLPFGTHVTFAYHGTTVEAVVDDRGPYIGGRDWDLNQNTAQALGFDGVDVVRSSVYGG
jgi:rare lipoprotein A (peptidoglycan hydrolase)